MTNNNYIGNTSTIIKTISMMITGWVTGILAAHGLDLGIDATQITEIITMIIFLGLAYIDAKYPNSFSFLENETITNDGLNDEYTTTEEVDE